MLGGFRVVALYEVFRGGGCVEDTTRRLAEKRGSQDCMVGML